MSNRKYLKDKDGAIYKRSGGYVLCASEEEFDAVVRFKTDEDWDRQEPKLKESTEIEFLNLYNKLMKLLAAT